MKIKHLFATILSLALVACQVAAPVNTPVINKANTQSVQPLSIAKPVLPALETTATVTQSGDKEQVKVQIKLPKGFRTQLANREQLAFIKVSLKGQGITGTLTHEGAAFLPVTGDTITASIDDVPLKNGDLRVVMVQGYDSSFNPLGAFEARGYYRSRTGVKTITISLRRSMILLGRILELALSNTALLNALDIPALQDILEDAMGFNPDTGEFNLDPSQLDAADILAMIPSGGSPLPTANDITGNAIATTQNVVINIETPNGARTNEVVRLVLTDPNSNAKLLPSRTASGTQVTFDNVVVGTWTLSAYDSDGNLLTSTQVIVSESDVTITTNPLTLNGVQQYDPEFSVNTYTANSQRKPSVAVDSDGDYVVTWQSQNQDESGFNIYGQRYNSAGVAQGSEFRVNTYTTGGQNNPSVAMDSDGDFVVTWESQDQDGSFYGIYGQRYNSSGLTQGSEFQVNTYTTNRQNTPSVAVDSDGDFVVTWQSNGQDGSNYGVYAQRYTSAGAAQGSEFQINTYTTNAQTAPSVAIDSDGDFVVTWQSNGQDGSSLGIYGRGYNSAGTAVTATEFQVNTYTTFSQGFPSVAVDSDGDFVVTWQSLLQDGSQYGIYGKRYTSTGAAQGSEFQVNTYTTDSQRVPSVAIDSDGDFVVTWLSSGQDGDGYGVYGRRYTSAGLAQGSEFQVNTYTTAGQNNPSVAVDSDGDFVVTWESSGQDGSGYGIYGKRYNAAGVEQ